MRKNKRILPKIYILCNTALAEPLYFKSYRDLLSRSQLVKVDSFSPISPWQFVDKAVKYRNKLQTKSKFSKRDGDQIWLVFDIDNYNLTNQGGNPVLLDQAIKKATDEGIKLAWSNECFELWFLLHFQTLTTGISRKDYDIRLKKHFKGIGKEYKKNINIFKDILDLQQEAIKNATQIFDNNFSTSPSTAVHLLIQELNNLRV